MSGWVFRNIVGGSVFPKVPFYLYHLVPESRAVHYQPSNYSSPSPRLGSLSIHKMDSASRLTGTSGSPVARTY